MYYQGHVEYGSTCRVERVPTYIRYANNRGHACVCKTATVNDISHAWETVDDYIGLVQLLPKRVEAGGKLEMYFT